jgi:chromosome segregation ATPase
MADEQDPVEATTEEITDEVAAISIPTDDDDEDDAAPKLPATPKLPQDEPLTLVEEDEGERADLEREIRSKDANISGLEKVRMEKEQELESLRKELDEERLLQMKESILHRIEVERLKRQTKAVEERLEVLEKDMQNKEAIREYAELIKSVAPKGGLVDSQYVMKLQSQLAKAVKRMDATSHQMTQLEHSCEEVVNSLKKEIGEIVEDRCRTELELKRQLELLEEQKLEIQSEYDDRIVLNQQELERLKEKVTVEVTLEDLEQEVEETEEKLMKLNNTTEMQERIVEELTNIAGDETATSGNEEE